MSATCFRDMAGKEGEKGVPLTGKAVYDADLYGNQTPYLATVDDDEAAEDHLDVLWVCFRPV